MATSSARASEPLIADEESQERSYANVSYWDIITNYVPMGWTAFGGPQAHIGMFETTFIEKKRWMSSTVFLELFALCSCLPGPTSTQMSFALGAMKRGILGGLLGGWCFQFPGLAMMSAVGVGAAKYIGKGDEEHPLLKATIDGLAAVGVALVAAAAKGLVTKQCTDKLTTLLCLSSAIVAFVFHAPWLFPVLILGGGLVTFVHRTVTHQRAQPAAMPAEADGVIGFGLTHTAGAMLLVAWIITLVSAAIIRASYDYDSHWIKPLFWFETFYRVGSLIYGGGQVVLPLLLEEVVQYTCTQEAGRMVCHERSDSWVTNEQFGAGLAIIQAMPGPMFNFAAYLGAVMATRASWNWAVGVAACWLGLMGSGVMIMYGVLPFWGSFRSSVIYRRALPGFNAAAVGLVVTAVFDLYNRYTASSSFPKVSVAIGIFGFGMMYLKLPAPLVVLMGGTIGAAAYLVHSHFGAHDFVAPYDAKLT